MTASSSPTSPAGKSSGTKQPSQVETDQKKPITKRSKRETISDDDPFDLERQQQTKKVIPLSRKPAKGKMFRVVCPMCDTPGFASPKVVGNEVKCRNPECLAPVFLVPDSTSQERKPKEESKTEDNKNSKLPLIAVVVLVSVSLGGAYWYFTGVEDSSELSKPFDNPIINQASQKSFRPEKNNTQVNSKNNNQQASSKTKEDPLSPALVQQEALESIVKLSRSRENRSKPFSRRLAAEAYAISGKINQAQEQIGRIDKVRPLLPFYKMFPLVEIGWIQLREKKGSDLKKTLEETEQLSKQIPEYGGRDSLDLVARLAAFWIAAGKEQQAVDLVKKYQAKSNLAQLSAYLQIAHESNQYNFDSLIDLHQHWDSPQWVAVTLILIARDYPQEALNWAALAPEPKVRTEAITQWALSQIEHAVKAKKKPEITLIQPIEKKLSATGNSYVYASCARKLISLKQPEAARTYLNKATSFLTNTAIPAPITLGDIKSVNRLTLPVALPLEMLAHAYVQIACTESELGLKAEATKSLNNAVQSIRAIAPSMAAVQNKINETANFNFQNDIKEALNLSSSDRVKMGVKNYRKQLRNLKSSAEKRLVLLVKLLSEASRSNLEIDAWNIALQSQKSVNDNLNDPLLKSSLPAVIIQSVGQKNNELISKIKETVNENVPALSQEDNLIQQATSLIKNGKPEQAAHEINQSEIKKPWKGQLSLKLLSYLLSQSEYNQAIQFIKAIKDPVLREDMLNTVGAVSAQHGTISPIKKELDSNAYTPTERISGLLGLISGIESLENQQTGVSTPQEQSKNL
ncbi:MAG: hypothetical protein K0U86_00840 [Planctomycetes bacterium]|nr:hypothetical protein [Planctomycetota bacterium]MCH9723434.1 hypothetical protein [Planctomycetota bacterium]MCH9775164.1 hypothetical protein [Planctomycetota bacterium]